VQSLNNTAVVSVNDIRMTSIINAYLQKQRLDVDGKLTLLRQSRDACTDLNQIYPIASSKSYTCETAVEQA